MRITRPGFSLAEVLIGLLVLALGILSIIMLFPIGIRAQEQVRYQMYASIKAMELSDAFAQHTKSFSDRVHEMPGNVNGRNILDGVIYGSYARFDAETVWATGGRNGVYPVPIEIARRLDSPGSEIQEVLDQGGYLFYHDPRPVRGFSLTEATNPSGAKTAPELQRLVFAVVGAPQQNALPQHPCVQGPVYHFFPFPPQGPMYNGSTIQAVVGNDGVPQHKYIWDRSTIAFEGFKRGAWEGINWELLASTRFQSSPWRDGIFAFRNLCYFGWTPIEFKLRLAGPRGGDDPDPNDGIQLRQDDNNIRTVSRLSSALGCSINIEGPQSGGVSIYWSDGKASSVGWANDMSGEGASYIRGYLDSTYAGDGAGRLTVLDAFSEQGVGANPQSFKQFVESNAVTDVPLSNASVDAARYTNLLRDVIGDTTDPDPAKWTYNELGSHNHFIGDPDPSDPRLPSLQQRYLYRWLALKLWRDVTEGSSLAGTNPLMQQLWNPDGTLPDVIALHPARVLALSHLADAAMRVGGMRLPYYEPAGSYGDMRNMPDRLGATNVNATDRTAKFAGSITDEIGPRQCLPEDVTMAKIAHENALRWAIAYANRFPRDNLVPRPANRQAMMDRALWQWDLFDNAGNAMRDNTPNTWQGSPMNGILPGYKVLPRPGIDPNAWNNALTGNAIALPRMAPGMQVEGGDQRYGGSPYANRIPNWFQRMNRATEPTFDVQTPARAKRFSLNLPFSAQNRMRQIVYWAVDWKGYEDSESAPSAPHGAEILSEALIPDEYTGAVPHAGPFNDFDPSEAPLIWFGRDRAFTYSALFGAQAANTSEGSGGGKMWSRRGAGSNISWSKNLSSIVNWWDQEGINHTFGLFGADRDGNGVYKGGSTKASVRLRAIEVARFNYYDPVVWCHVRK